MDTIIYATRILEVDGNDGILRYEDSKTGEILFVRLSNIDKIDFFRPIFRIFMKG